jgi:hypothetical protein
MNKKNYRRSIAEACRDIETRYAGNIFISYNDTDYTFSWILDRAAKRARFLDDRGYGKGDVIGILAPNSPEWCITFLAISLIGGITLPMDTGLDKTHYDLMCERAGAKAFVSAPMSGWVHGIDTYDILAEENYADTRFSAGVDVHCDEIAVLLFTSGTTGTPKIVSLTHANLLHIACVCTELEEYTEQDQTLALLPFFMCMRSRRPLWRPLYPEAVWYCILRSKDRISWLPLPNTGSRFFRPRRSCGSCFLTVWLPRPGQNRAEPTGFSCFVRNTVMCCGASDLVFWCAGFLRRSEQRSAFRTVFLSAAAHL